MFYLTNAVSSRSRPGLGLSVKHPAVMCVLGYCDKTDHTETWTDTVLETEVLEVYALLGNNILLYWL